MNTLRARLIGGYVLVVAITLVIALLLGRWLLDRKLVAGIDLLNCAEFQEIQTHTDAALAANSEKDFLHAVREHAEIDDPIYFFQVSRPDGEILFRSANMKSSRFRPNPPGAMHQSVLLPKLGAIRVSQFTAGPYHVQIGAYLGEPSRVFSAYSRVALILLGLALVLSLFFGYWLSRIALDPIRKIQQTASRISADNLGERIPVGDSRDELADLSRLLNLMFDRLECSFSRLWRFAGEASHELKTPLSVIRLQSEKLLLHGNLTPAQQEALQEQMNSINRLHSTIEKLLFISKSEFGAVRLNLRQQNTQELIHAFAEDALVLCEDAGVGFQVLANPPINATFDSALIRNVLLNLLSNALAVSPKEGLIALSSTKSHSNWVLSVEDSGPGLREDQLQEIFEPFHRILPQNNSTPASGSDPGAGAGLGLAICKSVVELHNGRILASNRAGRPGLKVSVELPL